MSAASLALLIGTLTGAVPPEQDSAGARPTLVRVVGTDNAPLAGARVICATAPMTGAARPDLSRVLEFRTDARGRARARIDPGRIWCVWAVWDGPDVRLSCPMRTNVVPGRPIRLQLQEFEAFRVRWLRINEWRSPDRKLSARFIVHRGLLSGMPERAHNVLGIARPHDPTKLDGFVCAMFEMKSPPDTETAVRLPPLPLHSYYAVLTDGAGGLLDLRYMNPAFHPKSNARVQHLYERENSLKQLSLGRPTEVRLALRSNSGKPVTDGHVFLRSDRASCELERRYEVRADGTTKLLLPYRKSGTFGEWNTRLYVCVPGHLPQYVLKSRLARRDGNAWELQLTRGRDLYWRLENATRADRRHGHVLLTTEVLDRKRRVMHTFPIRVERGGRLRLPAPIPGDHTRWNLVLVRDGRLVPLWLSRGGREIPENLTIDVDRIAGVTVIAESKARGPARGGILELHWGSDAPGATARHHLGRDGRCRFQVMPGEWFVTVRSPRDGDGFAALRVTAKGQQLRVALRPYRVLSGTVVPPGEKELTGTTTVSAQCQAPASAPPAVQRLVAASSRTIFCDEKGRFEAFVTGNAHLVALTVTAAVGRARMSARGRVVSQQPKQILLKLGDNQIRQWE